MKNNYQLKQGDIVLLITGSPIMVIRKIIFDQKGMNPESYLCDWFSGTHAKSKIFNENELIKIEKPQLL